MDDRGIPTLCWFYGRPVWAGRTAVRPYQKTGRATPGGPGAWQCVRPRRRAGQPLAGRAHGSAPLPDGPGNPWRAGHMAVRPYQKTVRATPGGLGARQCAPTRPVRATPGGLGARQCAQPEDGRPLFKETDPPGIGGACPSKPGLRQGLEDFAFLVGFSFGCSSVGFGLFFSSSSCLIWPQPIPLRRIAKICSTGVLVSRLRL